MTRGADVFSVDSHGSIVAAGDLSLSNGTFSVVGGSVTANSGYIRDSLTVNATLSVSETLAVGSTMRVSGKGVSLTQSIAIDSQPTPLLSLTSSSTSSADQSKVSLFEIHTKSYSGSVFRTLVDNVPVFDISHSGNLTVQSLKLNSGGIHVQAGGIRVGAGGLSVDGGISVLSGGLHLHDQDMKVKRLEAVSNDANIPAVVIKNTHNNFVGPLLQLQSETGGLGGSLSYDYIRALDKTSTKVFSVSGTGEIETMGTMKTKKDLLVGGKISVGGDISFEKRIIPASDVITIPIGVSYITIADNKAFSKNNLILPNNQEYNTASTGQYLVISNEDTEDTMNPVIPSGVTVQFIYNGFEWVDISSLRSPMQIIKNVKEFRALNDLSIGNVTVEMGSIRLTNLNRMSVPIVGVGGILVESEGLKYGKGILTTPAVSIQRIISDVDVRGNTIS